MKKIVITMVLLFVIGVIGTLVSVSASGGFSLDTYNIHDNAVVTNKDISKIEIDLSSSDLTVQPTSEDEISVELSGRISKKLKKKLKLDVNEKGETLKIGLKGEDQFKFNVGVLIVDTSVEVFLPEKLYNTIKIDTSSGDINVGNLKAKETVFEASSGDLTIKNLDSLNQRYHTSSGEMELSDVVGDITAESSSGDIIIQNFNSYGNIDASTSSGDITVGYKNTPSSLEFDFKGSSGEGEVTLDGATYEDKSEHEIRGKVGSGGFTVSAQTSSGDFYLK
ncbi:MAG TPA: DUF4097 family beta strand repeat-containing protein [Pseudoneobacillus sp.]|nr:DUF4097 family beta strand repeat-containing protein [Pseudoneobacillus sp.]